jgi:hypothetical protein
VRQAVRASAERLLGYGPAHNASALLTYCARRKSPDSGAGRVSVILYRSPVIVNSRLHPSSGEMG